MISFFCKHNVLLMKCFVDGEHTQWNLDTKVKEFHESISWNAPETVFHEMLWKKSFTLYPFL